MQDQLTALADRAVTEYVIAVGKSDSQTYEALLDCACRSAGGRLGHAEATRLMTQAATLQLVRQMITEATSLAEYTGPCEGPLQ